jgi:pimeloyl-ACP methyl ester carboxylesterase
LGKLALKSILNILILLIGVTIPALIFLYFFQSKLLYPAPNAPVLIKLPENVSKIDLGLSYAYLLKPLGSNNKRFPLLIFAHANAELADMWVDRFDYIVNSGIAVLLVEYPGYGNAQGETNLNTINTVMLNAFDKTVILPFINENLVAAYGRSIGGGPASLLAGQRPLIALGLESTFSDLPKLVSQKLYPSFLLKDRYDNQKIVESLTIPIFITHGINDVIIPFSHAQTLKKSAQDVTFHSAKCGHNNCPHKWREFVDFLKSKTKIGAIK